MAYSCQKTPHTCTHGSEAYMGYALRTANHYADSLDHFLAKWRQAPVTALDGSYTPGVSEVYLAALCANLYAMGQGNKYLEVAKTILVRYREYLPHDSAQRVEYAHGMPVVPNFFTLPKYARAAEVVLAHAPCTRAERQAITASLASSANFTLATQEFGPMNRAMLRAEGLLLTARAIPGHPNAPQWRRQGQAILHDNLTNWNMEDAGMYASIWLYSLCGYANYSGQPIATLDPKISYYFHYFKELYSPASFIPDYGDSWWQAWWQVLPAIMETGARACQAPAMRTVARDAYERNRKKGSHHIDLAMKLSEAALWADACLPLTKLSGGSRPVLDGAVGKKMVFRNGWDSLSSYALVNFRDADGHFANYISRTLSVEHEKPHHGHNDEGSLVCWLHQGSLLLHDAGYRDQLPSGKHGRFRADRFHNRLVARPGHLPQAQPFFKALANNGLYQAQRTEMVDFGHNTCVDHLRMAIHGQLGMVHHRIVDFLKKTGEIVVIDLVWPPAQGQPTTAAALWHGQQVVDSGSGYWAMRYNQVEKWDNPGTHRALLVFPQPNAVVHAGGMVRHRQWERSLAYMAQWPAKTGQPAVLVSVLIPLEAHALAAERAAAVAMVKSGPNCVAVQVITNQGDTIILAHKVDLDAEVARDWPRPRYTYASGSMWFGHWATDAQRATVWLMADSVHCVAHNLTAVEYRGKTLHRQADNTNEYQPQGGPPTANAWKARRVRVSEARGHKVLE
jgi:hypothetical protein